MLEENKNLHKKNICECIYVLHITYMLYIKYSLFQFCCECCTMPIKTNALELYVTMDIPCKSNVYLPDFLYLRII